MVDMVITRIWFSGRKSRSVNNFFSSRILDFKNQPGTRNQKKTRFQYKAKANKLGIWFSLARYSSPVLRG